MLNLAQASILDRLPSHSRVLFEAKTPKQLSFEDIAKALGRSEVAVAALFYGQAQASNEDAEKLSALLGVSSVSLVGKLTTFPDRGRAGPMPPVEPLIYRLYEIVQNYGYAYKAVLNEKFGDGIMSAIAFSTNVEKEVDDHGVAWVNISMRGKWYVSLVPPVRLLILCLLTRGQAAFHTLLVCQVLRGRSWQKTGRVLQVVMVASFREPICDRYHSRLVPPSTHRDKELFMSFLLRRWDIRDSGTEKERCRRTILEAQY